MPLVKSSICNASTPGINKALNAVAYNNESAIYGVLMSARKHGFTLLEMSIVVTIIAILAGGGVAVFMGALQRWQLQDSYDKMHAIQQALFQYRVAFNRLPCPADATISMDGAAFGVEAENKGDCDGDPAANFHTSNGATEAPHQGMVPVKTLRLPDDFAFDGWGRRIMYSVSGEMTKEDAFTSINANDTTERMTIMDASGSPKTEVAGYVLLSFGANGHGGFSRNGGPIRVNASSINAGELENCDCDSNTVSTGFDNIFVQRDPSQAFLVSRNVFDDIIMYGTRNDLRTLGE
jgi:prepilin-type N-terminal cleavage/methylation domain-containing protein